MKVLNYKGMDFVIAITIGIIIIILIYGYKSHCNEREKFSVGGQAKKGVKNNIPDNVPNKDVQTPFGNYNPRSFAQYTVNKGSPKLFCPESQYNDYYIWNRLNLPLDPSSPPGDPFRTTSLTKGCNRYKVTPLDETGIGIQKEDLDRFEIPSASLTSAGYTGLSDVQGCTSLKTEAPKDSCLYNIQSAM